MTEIDFEELDKAVSSLMGKAGNVESTDETVQKDRTLTIKSTLKPDEKPVPEKLVKVAKKIGNETLTDETEQEREIKEQLRDDDFGSVDKLMGALPKQIEQSPDSKPTDPSAKPPKSGRFMDVVHPSSDMRIPGSPQSPSVPERQGLSAPIAQKSDKSVTEPSDSIASQPQLKQQMTPSGDSDSVPLSPFLANAKVEKRPLGGGSMASTGGELNSAFPEVSPELEHDTLGDSINSLINGELDYTQTANEEESDTQRALDASSLETIATPEEKELQRLERLEVKEDIPVPEKSIQDVESGDTEHATKASAETDPHYHAPITHPAKQKSGWGVVIIILVIIVFSAAIAAALYFTFGMGV